MAYDPTLDQAIARVGAAINAKWTIDELLGSGGMATVYAATHRNGSRAALKVLHAELARDTAIRDRFLREGRIANKIDHPSVVQILDDDVSDQGEVFLVMELLEGETLEAHMRRQGGKLSIDEIFRIFDPVLELLTKAHEVGIVHRDIKPENVFLTKPGIVKVLDFGIARFREQKGGAEATRQGTALGTPSFMAPEQALGLGDLVDGRADLFSVGACIYTALTGTRLHEGRAENEAFVLAATKAAPSIANAAPDLPVEIVAFVDKALAYERNSRFQDAATMRAEMRALLAAWQSGRLTSAAKRAGGLVVKGEELDEDDGISAEAKNDIVRRMKNVWKLLGMFVSSTRQYGWNHPESGRHLQTAFDEVVEALSLYPERVRWDVTPYAFLYEGTPIWEPERPPFDRMPFQLFSDGLRKVQLRPGITEQELRDLVAVLMRDASEAVAEDDTITSLWDRHFQHVAYLAIDSFAEGDAEDRDAFEKECANLAGQAIELARINKDWDETSLEAQAQQVNLAAAMQGAAESAAALALDPGTRAALTAQLTQSSDRWTERYVEAFAHGFLEARAQGSGEPLAAALREWSTDQITLRNYPIVFRMFTAITEAVRLIDPERAQEHERDIALAMFPASALRTVISKLSEEPSNNEAGSEQLTIDAALATSIEHVLDLIAQGSLLPLACERLDVARNSPLGDVLFRYVKKWARGNEEAIAARLDSFRMETAIELVRVLAEIPGPSALEALLVAFRSPHPEVRVEALARLPDVGSENVPREILVLLQDPESSVREEALRVVAKFKMRTIGPEIVRFIGSPAFHARSIDERKIWLQTLASLNPARAESLAVEMLTTWTFVPKPEHERTRVAAAEALALFGSRHVVDAIRTAARKRWWNTPPVREAAERALQAISERAAAATKSQQEGRA